MNVIRTNMQNLAMLSAVVTFAACESHKKVEIKEDGTQVVTARTPEADTLNKQADPPMHNMAATGKVLEINRGKDGYTAKIETSSKAIYFVTVSHSNLTDHMQYRDVKIGDEISVVGDHWKNGEGNDEITVREIK